MSTFFQLDDNGKKTFKILTVLSILYVLPIILADFYYVDDLGRNLFGYTVWETRGRPLATIIMKILNFGAPLLDLAPFPLLLGIILLSYSLTLFSQKYFNHFHPLFIACALFFFVGNPFLLQNFSYKYDSFSMLLSLSSVILLFATPVYIGKICLFFISSLYIIITLTTYQPSLCSFFCFIVMVFIFDILNTNKKSYIYIYIYYRLYHLLYYTSQS